MWCRYSQEPRYRIKLRVACLTTNARLVTYVLYRHSGILFSCTKKKRVICGKVAVPKNFVKAIYGIWSWPYSSTEEAGYRAWAVWEGSWRDIGEWIQNCSYLRRISSSYQLSNTGNIDVVHTAQLVKVKFKKIIKIKKNKK